MTVCCRDCRWWGGQADAPGARCHRADTHNTIARYPESGMCAGTLTGPAWLWTMPNHSCAEFSPRDSSAVPPDTARTLLTMTVGHLLHPDDYGDGDRASLIVQIRRYLREAA